MKYYCSLDRDIHSETPSKCPKCGLDLLPEEKARKTYGWPQTTGNSVVDFTNSYAVIIWWLFVFPIVFALRVIKKGFNAFFRKN